MVIKIGYLYLIKINNKHIVMKDNITNRLSGERKLIAKNTNASNNIFNDIIMKSSILYIIATFLFLALIMPFAS